MKPTTSINGSNKFSAIGKKLFLAVAATVLITASSFADPTSSNDKASGNLSKMFSGMENLQWKTTKDYTKASFTWSNQRMEVFFNLQGELMSVSKHITLENLPVAGQLYIERKFSDYTITDIIEYSSEESGLVFFVSVQKGNKKEILKVSTEGQVEYYRP